MINRLAKPARGFVTMEPSNALVPSNQASIFATASITTAMAWPILRRLVPWAPSVPLACALRRARPANSPARAVNNVSMIRACRSIAIKSLARKAKSAWMVRASFPTAAFPRDLRRAVRHRAVVRAAEALVEVGKRRAVPAVVNRARGDFRRAVVAASVRSWVKRMTKRLWARWPHWHWVWL